MLFVCQQFCVKVITFWKNIWIKKSSFYYSLAWKYNIVTCYISVRIFDPYIFESPSIINPAISSSFLTSLNSLRTLTTADTTFPPSLQWIGKPPVLFSLYNLAIFGIGIPIFILSVIGFIKIFREKILPLNIIAIWTMAIFIFQSTQFAQNMRYFLFIYPFLSIFSAMAVVGFIKQKVLLKNSHPYNYCLYLATTFFIYLYEISYENCCFQMDI